MMHPKPFTSKYAHGFKNEPLALQEYVKFMFNRKTPVAVVKSGLVASKVLPVLGATPDAKIVDFGCVVCFGLAKVKCPHTTFHVTPLDACSDPTFFMEKISENKRRLKRDHAYYAQAQGQMGITGAKWCDCMCTLVKVCIQLFRQRLSHKSEQAYATMPIGVMGRKSLVLIDRSLRRLPTRKDKA